MKEVNPKTRWELLDHDYLDDLSDAEKTWLSNFNEEYISGNFNHEGTKFHKTKKEKRACYTRNNARNRDTFAINRTRGWVSGAQSLDEAMNISNDPFKAEDILLALLDIKRELDTKDGE